MFEIIGLVIAPGLFFALSLIVGYVYGRVAGLLLRSQEHRKFRTIAVFLPPSFAAYMLACAITFSSVVPGQSELLFGGISERLPNGYILMALGKMPEYGRIEASSTTRPPILKGYFGSLAVDDALVFGAYNWRYEDQLPSGGPGGGDKGYFSFDTLSGKVTDFGTLAELERFAGHSVRLVENQSFSSLEARQNHAVNVERAIYFGPPLVCTILYFLFLLRLRVARTDSQT